MIKQVQDIESLSEEWELNKEERTNLYIKCADALRGEGEYGHAAHIYIQVIRLIGNELPEKRQLATKSLIIISIQSK